MLKNKLDDVMKCLFIQSQQLEDKIIETISIHSYESDN